MNPRRMAVLATAGALAAGGAGAAVAAVTSDDRKKAEQELLDDAAKRLDVAPQKLRDALAAARDAQLDQAVKDGKLTQEQADAIKKARADSGLVLGGPRGGPGHRRGHGPRGSGGALLGDVAKALGMTRAELGEQLRAGKTLADVAKAKAKTLASVRSAVKAAVKTRLDKAVENEDITRKQADAMLARVDDKLEAIESGKALRGHRGRGPGRFGGPAGGRGGLLADIAKALDTTPAELGEKLKSGTSLADAAKAKGKTLADVRKAVKAAVKTRLDKAVENEDITRRQADAMLARVDDKLEAIESGKALRGHRGRGPDGPTSPGSFEAPPAAAPAAATPS